MKKYIKAIAYAIIYILLFMLFRQQIENEYAVMAAAMHKKGYSKSDIKSWMQRVSKDAQRSRF